MGVAVNTGVYVLCWADECICLSQLESSTSGRQTLPDRTPDLDSAAVQQRPQTGMENAAAMKKEGWRPFCLTSRSPSVAPPPPPFFCVPRWNEKFWPLDPFRPISNMFIPEGFPAHPHRGFQTVTYAMKVRIVRRQGGGREIDEGRDSERERKWLDIPG